MLDGSRGITRSKSFCLLAFQPRRCFSFDLIGYTGHDELAASCPSNRHPISGQIATSTCPCTWLSFLQSSSMIVTIPRSLPCWVQVRYRLGYILVSIKSISISIISISISYFVPLYPVYPRFLSYIYLIQFHLFIFSSFSRIHRVLGYKPSLYIGFMYPVYPFILHCYRFLFWIHPFLRTIPWFLCHLSGLDIFVPLPGELIILLDPMPPSCSLP